VAGSAALRKGKATEALIASMCVLASGGELNPLTALVDDEGVDLGLWRRGGRRVLSVQVKSRFVDEDGCRILRTHGQYMADVRLETFSPRQDLYMLFVVMDGRQASVVRAWLVPSTELAARGFRAFPKGIPHVRFQASSFPQSNDRWRHRRLERDELVPALLEVLRALDGDPRQREARTAPEPGTCTRQRRWTEDRVGAELAAFLDEVTPQRFPTYMEFRQAGREDLRKEIQHLGGAQRWAATVGLACKGGRPVGVKRSVASPRSDLI
jgi:hypothetical protein